MGGSGERGGDEGDGNRKEESGRVGCLRMDQLTTNMCAVMKSQYFNV